MPKSVQPLEPLPGYVVLKEYKLEQKMAGRLLMPQDAQTKPSLGEVISIGDLPIEVMKIIHEITGTQEEETNYKRQYPGVSEGDIVAYQNYGGQELTLDGVKYLLVPFDKLISKVNVKE